MKLQLVNYREHWHSILPGLGEALKPQQEGIWPEDVFADLKAGYSSLFLCEDGFVILRPEPTAGARKRLLVWFAYSSSGSSVIRKYADDIDAIAKMLECQTVEFADPSARRGYERVLPEGYDTAYVMWSRRVN